MCTTADELLDAAIGRLVREHVLLETMLRALRWQLHLNAGGSPEDTALVPSRDFSRLMRECSTEANRIIDDVDLLDQLNETLDQANQINEGRNRFCHDLLLPAMGGGPGWNRSRWQKDRAGFAGTHQVFDHSDVDAVTESSRELRTAITRCCYRLQELWLDDPPQKLDGAAGSDAR